MVAPARIERRPLVALVVVFLLGSVLGQRMPASMPWLFFAFCASVALWLKGRTSRSVGPAVSAFCVQGSVLFAAWGASSVDSIAETRAQARFLTLASARRRCQVVGRIHPDIRKIRSTERFTLWRVNVDVLSVKADCQPPDCRGAELTVWWYGPASDARGVFQKPSAFERWQFSGKLRKNVWGQARFVSASLSAGPRASRRIGQGLWSRVARLCDQARMRAAALLSLGIDDAPEAVGFLHAILLGYRNSLPKSLAEDFKRSGTMHLFAVSGLHVGMIVVITLVALPLTHLPRTLWFPLMFPVLIVYALVTGARPSAVRACVMALVYFLAPMLGRRADTVNALALSALLIVGWDPSQVFSAGFILSFVIVTGLLAMVGPVEQLLRSRFGWHAMDEAALRLAIESGERGWRIARERFRLRLQLRASQLVALSVSAWLSSLPLQAYYFHRISLVALLANIFVVPLAFGVVVSGCLSLISGIFFTVFAEIFNNAALFLVTTLVTLTRLLAAIPFAAIPVPAPPWWGILLWYMALGILAARLRRWQRERASDELDWLQT